ncbi:MAG TPA: precorrin-6A synthase (deacetylating) [Polyangiales bacterium]|nr:precorrin-6A synthase (deacetylating) [Polyangiales bacterium]
MRKLSVIGMGVGDPEQLTVQAIDALNRVDVFFAMDKGSVKADLLQLRKQICRRYIRDRTYRFVEITDPQRDAAIDSYTDRVQLWHEQRAALWRAQFERELGAEGRGGFLVWGDPALYDSTLRILEALAARGGGFEYEVIPGISAVQALAASHRIPLNRIGGAVHITTGRRLAADVAAGNDDVVVMLDGECAWKALDPAAFEIYWGAYLGSPQQLLAHGRLCDVGEAIESRRAAARAEHGWIMDTYLLRRL